jgi:multiphosphoryl transfer protein
VTGAALGTVGIVVVSHSRALAGAAIELAAAMLQGPHRDAVRVEEAAGLDEGVLGTDAVRVADAIARADAGRGVVVLVDLGSAVLSAELALDLLDPIVGERVTLSPAPLVEGLCVAVVAAAGGADRRAVAAEAQRALTAKQEHLGGTARNERVEAEPPADVTGRFEIGWPQGLHARSAAVLVQAVRGLDADVRLRNLTRGGDAVPAGSITRVATLGAAQGHVIEVLASGPDADRAVDRLLTLSAGGFGDVDLGTGGPT